MLSSAIVLTNFLPLMCVATPVPAPTVVPFKGPKAPWLARRAKKLKPNRMGVVDLKIWPQEPAEPKTYDTARFAKALRQLCGWMPPSRPLKYASWILEASRTYGVDPTLLAALIVDQSRCRRLYKDNHGIGLTRISVAMHRNHFRNRNYRYFIHSADGWRRKEEPILKHLFYDKALGHAQANITFAAAFLKVFKAQCPHIDGAFRSLKHRHYVSHFVWGDRVRGTDAEDRILTARRRFIAYYTGDFGTGGPTFRGVLLRSPLDGAPRKLTSKLGDMRDGGRRRHRGIDYQSYEGEPVRAVASGTVIIAGVDRRGAPVKNMSPERAAKLPPSSMSGGGLVVMVRHDPGWVTAYMHLKSYSVRKGDTVVGGQSIGQVGRTGIKAGAEHLHFEFRVDKKRIDPIPHLGPLVISPMKTYRGIALDYDEARLRRQRRINRRKKK